MPGPTDTLAADLVPKAQALEDAGQQLARQATPIRHLKIELA